MLTNRLPTFKLFCFFFLLSFSHSLFAQPANDKCSSPTLLEVGLDSATCIPVRGDTRGTEDATLLEDTPDVCSGTWFTDDVWYSINTGDEVPPFGITVEVRLDPSSETELIEHGMATYLDCDEESKPIDCFSDMPGRRTIEFHNACLAPNSTYLVRLWSAPEPRTNEGTFSICAYQTPQDTTSLDEDEPMSRVIYEETFDQGLNGWESVSQSQSFDINIGEMVDNHWMWTNTNCFMSEFGNDICLNLPESICLENGVIGVPAGFYQSEWDGNPSNIVTPFPRVKTYIVSPPIDLSEEECVDLMWTESASFRNNGNTFSLGAYVEYSIDEGQTWLNPSKLVGSDVTMHYGVDYSSNMIPGVLNRVVPLYGAEGNGDVRIRFRFDGDFHHWIVDDIRIIESVAADAVAQENSFARATINPMSIHMIDPYDFVINVENFSCEDLTNVNANMSITNTSGEVVHNVDFEYGTILSDNINVENQSFLQPFSPPAITDDYVHTYTITADRDDDLSNNVKSFQSSVVDETEFRKENGSVTDTLSPNKSTFWSNSEPFTWEMGNIFYAPNAHSISGEPLRFNEISFQLVNPNELIGDVLKIWLYEISDNNFNHIIAKDDDSELTRLGVSEYTITGSENGLITVQLTSYTGNDDELLIKPNTHYMATVETTTEVLRETSMAIAANDTYDYTIAVANARKAAVLNGDIKLNRYAHSFAITKENYFRIGPGTLGDDRTGNFPENTTPIIRLGYEVVNEVSTNDINRGINLNVFPNPVSSQLTLNLSIDNATDMQISIVDLVGRELSAKSQKGVTELTETFDVSNLANGVYMIHINTKDGVKTEKFVISR